MATPADSGRRPPLSAGMDKRQFKREFSLLVNVLDNSRIKPECLIDKIKQAKISGDVSVVLMLCVTWYVRYVCLNIYFRNLKQI